MASRRLFDPDPEREQRRQEKMMRRIDRTFAPQFQAEIGRAMLELSDAWQEAGAVPIVSPHFERVQTIAEAQAWEAIKVFGVRFLELPKAAPGPNETRDFAVTLRKFARRFILGEAFRQRITSIANTTRDHVIRMIDRGNEEGLGQDGTAKLIRDVVPRLSRARAGMIARTETHNAANYGAVQAAKETGLPLRKEWMAAADERTRFQHAALHGKIVDADDKFEVQTIRDDLGYLIAYPGDPEAPAYGTINCRCALAWVTED